MDEPKEMGKVIPYHVFLVSRLKTFSKKDLVERILASPGCSDTPLMVRSRSKEVLGQWLVELCGGSVHGADASDAGEGVPLTQTDV